MSTATLTRDQVPQIAARLLRVRAQEQHRLRKIDRYYKNRPDSVYTPRGAKTEFNWIRDRAKVNYIPLVVRVTAQNLHVDGYRMSPEPIPERLSIGIPEITTTALPAQGGTSGTNGTGAGTPTARVPQGVPTDGSVPEVPQVPQVPQNSRSVVRAAGPVTIPTDLLFDDTTAETQSAPWKLFLANKMDSRQHGLHLAIMKYGVAYGVTLPGRMQDSSDWTYTSQESVPVMRAVSPKRMTAYYADDVDDEWPIYALEEFPYSTANGTIRIVRLYDDTNRYTLVARPNQQNPYWPDDDDDFLPAGTTTMDEHGLGVCPVVRFQSQIDLDGEDDVTGEVEPLIHIQDQINSTTFNKMIAENFASFRQRWVTGMTVTDEEGRQQEPFRAGIDRLWVAEDADTKFGEFSQTSLGDHLNGIEASIRHMSTIGQVPPYHLLGLVANLSAEALAAARDGLDRKVEELQGTLQGSYRQWFQLASHAAGDDKSARDNGATVVWRDTSARAFSATVDALGKISQMLGVPATELWDRIPGVSAADVARWKASLAQPGVLEELNELIEKALTKGAQSATPGSSPDVADYQTYESKAHGV